MTRKHFEALAANILTIKDIDTRLEAARAVAQACRQFNPRFNIAQFYEACNVLNFVR